LGAGGRKTIALPPSSVGSRATLQNLSNEVRECLRRDEECKRLAECAPTEAGKLDYLEMERRWLCLARSYEFEERLANFVEPLRKPSAAERISRVNCDLRRTMVVYDLVAQES
jgi:hypothetical protein